MSAINIRPAILDDLPAINRVIEAAVMTWDLPERVKRLSLPSYRYDAFDFDHLQMVVADDASGQLVGLASWEAADPRDCPADRNGLLLHGLYVDPAHHRRGVGTALLNAAVAAVSEAGCDGLLIKAQADAVGFFVDRGLELLPVEDHGRHYGNRFWKAIH